MNNYEKVMTIDELFEDTINNPNKCLHDNIIVNIITSDIVQTDSFNSPTLKFFKTANDTNFMVEIIGNKAKFSFVGMSQYGFENDKMFIGEDKDEECSLYNKFKTKALIEFKPFTYMSSIDHFSRYDANKKILSLLEKFVEAVPDIRFGQIMEFIKDSEHDDQFYVESNVTLNVLKNFIKKNNIC